MSRHPENATPPDRPRRPVRWWPLGLIVALVAVALAVVWAGIDAPRQQKNTASAGVLLAGLLLVLLWGALLSRLRWEVRLCVCLGPLLLIGLAAALLRVDEVTGDLLPVLVWRWEADREWTASAVGEGVSVEAAPDLETGPTPHDFPQFLGPERDGTVTGVTLATDWESDPPVELWRREVGAAWSGFAVVGDVAVTQEQRGTHEVVAAYHRLTGEPLWVHADDAHYDTTIGGEGPRATPTVANGRVFTLGATGLLNALDLATGKPLWQRNIVEAHGASVPSWGLAGSPLIAGDAVVVSAGGPGGASLVAYDAASGDSLWGGGDGRAGYSSPVLLTLAGVEQIVIFNHEGPAAHRPSDGSVLWSYPWKTDHPHVAVPAQVAPGRLVFSSGYGHGSELLEVAAAAGGSGGGGFTVSRVWKSPRLKSKFANLVLHRGAIFGLDDGILACIDAATGTKRWKRFRPGHGQLLLVGGDVLLVSAENGDLVLFAADPDNPRELARFSALSDKTWNPPALSGDLLLLRNHREAACFRLPLVDGGDGGAGPAG